MPSLLDEIVGKVVAEDVVDLATGEILVECNEELTEAIVAELKQRDISSIDTLFIDDLTIGPFIRNTLIADKLDTPEEAILENLQASPRRSAPRWRPHTISLITYFSTQSATTSVRLDASS